MRRNSKMTGFSKKNIGVSLFWLLLSLSLLGCAQQSSGAASTELSAAESSSTDKETLAVTEADLADTIESDGFEEPEEALAAYLMGIKEMDFPKMLGCFAVESYVKNYNFKDSLDQYGAYTGAEVIKYPNSDPLLERINVENRINSITEDITSQYFILGYTNFEEEPVFQPGKYTEIDDEYTSDLFIQEFDDFVDGIEPDSLKLLGFVSPEELSDVYNKDGIIEIFAKKARLHGADKIESCVAVFEIHGDKWQLSADTVNYGGKWYIMDLRGTIGTIQGIPVVTGGAMPISDWDSQWESKLRPVM